MRRRASLLAVLVRVQRQIQLSQIPPLQQLERILVLKVNKLQIQEMCLQEVVVLAHWRILLWHTKLQSRSHIWTRLHPTKSARVGAPSSQCRQQMPRRNQKSATSQPVHFTVLSVRNH